MTKSKAVVIAELTKLVPSLVPHLREDRDWFWYCGPDLPSPGRARLIKLKRAGVCDETGVAIAEGKAALYVPAKREKGSKAKLFALSSRVASAVKVPIVLMHIGFKYAPNGHALEDGTIGSWGHSCEHPTRVKHTGKAKPAKEEVEEPKSAIDLMAMRF